MENIKLKLLVISFIVSVIFIGIVGAIVPSKSDNALYTIISENGKTYYSNEFRVYGRGVVFTDVYGKTVIIQGDLEIVKKADK
jgi:hypothetical protein